MQSKYGREIADFCSIDIRDRAAIRAALDATVLPLSAASTSSSTPPRSSRPRPTASSPTRSGLSRSRSTSPPTICSPTSCKSILDAQGLDASIVLTSSANAVVAKRGSEAYDVSKAALSHLVRELAVSLSPKIRVNGISPATVVKGSTMFPRDRVIASLTKYNFAFDESEFGRRSPQRAGALLCQAHAHASAHRPEGLRRGHPLPRRPEARCTTGHLIPVDGGLVEAYLR